MAVYLSYLGLFLISFIALGIFYHNTMRNGLLSLYFLFFAFTTYTFFCNVYFHLLLDAHFLVFYVAQGWFVLSYLLKKRKKQPSRTYQEPTRRAASFPVEQEKEYAAQ
ncbi:hypothetical protein [Aneurinibacillus aneurinilyticus]|uniref:Uncharacterized protein n=2 Tax=Aneurinibacillus aneurinilyticus TaxID=1391 RepID=A0A848CZV9_ANEAE|nr:hypothetical protein [Aneurinibacillus aneurinilyticus]ERI04622.1 hypothetical protein HMPREF0083_05996 [Aneurinibacillus aneurinilyticus ATCC 12856]MCI1696968.1 hypothetical protein [Aneurinibacillus aneurinilyticus]MED0672140.1 hypothetical protein [Aneurinibacillus aneurinilyticus]MED0709617.1 hypothetical protein [Aneurinibacillus aneurinilyticus]MED0726348.1 hypothetical protein [Aneurinibacillus aneurinilyticus]